MVKKNIQVLIRGGMGNQMFQAAFAKVLAIKFQSVIEFIDISSNARVKRNWSLSCFGMEPKVVSEKIKFVILLRVWIQRIVLKLFPGYSFGILIEQKEFSSPGEIKSQPTLVTGYWQCSTSLENYSQEIKKLFSFPELTFNLDITQRIARQLPLVAIHVRRGDYITDPIAKSVHLVCTPEWYCDAWNFLKKQLGDCQAIVYSDDMDWVKNNVFLEGKIFYSDTKSSEEWVDMASMANCDHFIISNSTYSWWAAFLGQTSRSIVIAPKQWLVGTKTADIEICPKSWILM